MKLQYAESSGMKRSDFIWMIVGALIIAGFWASKDEAPKIQGDTLMFVSSTDTIYMEIKEWPTSGEFTGKWTNDIDGCFDCEVIKIDVF